MNTNKVSPEELKEEIASQNNNSNIVSQNNNYEVNTDEGDLVDDKYTDSLGYTKADFNKAKQFREDQLVRDVGNKLYPFWVSNFEFAKFGIGVYLYFSYLKVFCIMLWILTIFMVPALVSNLLGAYYQEVNSSVVHYTTLGNQYGFKDQTIDKEWLNFSENSRSYKNAVIISDWLVIIILYVFLLIFKVISRRNIYKSLIQTYSPSDYAWYVTGFADDAVTEQDIQEHFSKYGPIVEIVFARRFSKLIKDYKAQDELNKALK